MEIEHLTCYDCEFFTSCEEPQTKDACSFCSRQPNIMGVCALWGGPKYEVKTCTSFVINSINSDSCISCMHFHNCKIDGNDVKSYCSPDSKVKGVCTLWDGPKEDTIQCSSWSKQSSKS